jgi:hypothetical protein
LRNENVFLFGRDSDRALLLDHLDEGGVLLVGPRRIGKTELIRQLCREPPADVVAVRVDLEGLSDAEGAVERLREALSRQRVAPRRVLDKLKSLRRVEVAGVVELERSDSGDGAAVTAFDALETLLDATVEKLPDKARLWLMLDELPWWLDSLRRPLPGDPSDASERAEAGAARARRALAQLRYLRQREGLGSRLRMMLTGSVGLASLARELGASAELNDLTSHELGPLAPPDGAALFEAGLAGRGLGSHPDVAQRAHELAGGSPHWIKQLAAKVGSREVDAGALDAAVEQLLSPRMRHLFDDEGDAHLRRRHGDQAPVLKAVLSTVSASDAGMPRAALLAAAMTAGASRRPDAERAVGQLIDEFYLDEIDGRVRFANPLFRLWWQRYGSWP